ncbi:MAG TPA: DUF1501 domain-containing protein, partial [Armatimonadota bacterium]|nr:DUF1501 domain-containing protein [Armatimonadota bacterium]
MGVFRTCDGVSRRDFIKVGTLGLAGLTLPEFLQLREAAAAPKPERAKAVILLWMGGGPSHLDTFDPKPDAPSDYRGEFNAIGVKGADFQISEHLPRLAQMGDRFSVLRSVTHPEGAHERGTTYMLTGYRQIPGFEYPGFGSVVAKEKGWQKNMPPYVAIPGVIGDAGPGYLGADGSPFSAGDPGAGNYQVKDILLPQGVDEGRLGRRREFLAAADQLVRTGKADDPVTGVDRFYGKAYELITSAETRKAFDLKQEPDALRDRYGRNGLGQGCLLARRLIESGVRFVTISRGGWDNHGGIFGALRNQRLPELDTAMSALLQDLGDRGMLNEVMVVWMGEFGRTPKVNMTGGRDHWPKVASV